MYGDVVNEKSDDNSARDNCAYGWNGSRGHQSPDTAPVLKRSVPIGRAVSRDKFEAVIAVAVVFVAASAVAFDVSIHIAQLVQH